MAKVSFTKLGLNKIKEYEVTQINFNDQVIEVKNRIPMNEKIEMLSEILTFGNNGVTFRNTIQLKLYMEIGIIKYYTNINFTEKQLEEIIKTYDLLDRAGLVNEIIKAIPEDEIKFIYETIDECSKDIIDYYNSARGLLESIGLMGENLSVDAAGIQGLLADPENLKLVKDILGKLG